MPKPASLVIKKKEARIKGNGPQLQIPLGRLGLGFGFGIADPNRIKQPFYVS